VNEPSTLPSLASVIFARITEFVRRPVAEQARLRAQLEAALAVSLEQFPSESRIILDAPDGVAVVVLGDPAGALEIAQRCSRVTAAGVAVAIAINHGAVRPAPDDEGLQGMIGDAIGTAAAIAHYAGAGRLFVSRTFRDALAAAAPHHAVGLRPAGVFTDANVRTHEVLSPDPNVPGRRRKVLAAVGAIVMVGLLPPRWSSAKKFAAKFMQAFRGCSRSTFTRMAMYSWTEFRGARAHRFRNFASSPAGTSSKCEKRATHRTDTRWSSAPAG